MFNKWIKKNYHNAQDIGNIKFPNLLATCLPQIKNAVWWEMSYCRSKSWYIIIEQVNKN